MSTTFTIVKNVIRQGVCGQRREFHVKKNWCKYVMPDRVKRQTENPYYQQKARMRNQMMNTTIRIYKPHKVILARAFKFPQEAPRSRDENG
nr:unnamed protein product [Callosobruchus analis]